MLAPSSVDCLDVCHGGERRSVKVVFGVILLLNTVAGIIAVVAIVYSATSPGTARNNPALNVAWDEAYRGLELSNQEQPQGTCRRRSIRSSVPQSTEASVTFQIFSSGLDFDTRTAVQPGSLSAMRNWANPDGSDRKLLYNGMRYKNGSITVPAPGVYHITSHAKFYIEGQQEG
ncbi:uncharacterized protein LOC124268573 [Haliotis rubra]|uniref:uncharacterized protein LOC124268573 n=1 Tax=Haliotis rubra TaxID=36100 RepID=UPI001EE5EDC1|nr:uncharacterized protein LOC124268573 [Haliotis rubra]